MKDKDIETLKAELKEEIKQELKEEIMIELLKKLLCGKNENIEKVDNKELEKLNKDKEKLKKELENIKTEKEKVEILNNNQQQKIDRLNQEKANLDNKIIQLEKSQVKELKEFEELYFKLSDTTKNGLQNVLKNSNQLSLFCSGIKNIDAVWDYALYLETEHKDEEFKIMKNMFYILFRSYQNIENVSLDEVSENDEFDSDLHLRNSRSEEYNGKIKKVLLKGYKKRNKIIKQSLVEL